MQEAKKKPKNQPASDSSHGRSDHGHSYDHAPTSAAASSTSGYVPLGEDNVGMKMMKRLGWKEGEGLGKFNSGITTPVEVKKGYSSCKIMMNNSSGVI